MNSDGMGITITDDGRDDNGRWTRGHSGNPGGKRTNPPLGAAIRARLDEIGDDGMTRGQRIARVLVDMAEAGDLRAIREVLDRAEGKPTQAVSLNAHEEIVLKPITFERCALVERMA